MKKYKVTVCAYLYHLKYNAKTKKKSYKYQSVSVFTTIRFRKLQHKHIVMLTERELRRRNIPFDICVVIGYAPADHRMI
jgi:hypothetical protein